MFDVNLIRCTKPNSADLQIFDALRQASERDRKYLATI